jgi:DNA mismatch endonuclease (patch repair protein)
MERRLLETLDGGKFRAGTPGNTRRMKAIRSTGNKSTERRFRGLLVRAGVKGWKVNPTGLPGKPDFLFPLSKVVVFLDGCYWHGCPRCGHVGEINKPYWSAKIQGNRDRDQRHTRQLEADGYRVLRFWEHELAESPGDCVQAVKTAVKEKAGVE